MINNVYTPASDWLIAHSSQGSMPYISPTQPMTGIVRYNNNQMQVYDGNGWQSVGGGMATIDLTARTKAVLEWAKYEMLQQRKYEELAKKHPAMQDALDNIEIAKEKLKVIAALVEEEEQNA